MLDGVKITVLGLLTLLLAMAANYGQDQVYTFHALLLTAVAGIAVITEVIEEYEPFDFMVCVQRKRYRPEVRHLANFW